MSILADISYIAVMQPHAVACSISCSSSHWAKSIADIYSYWNYIAQFELNLPHEFLDRLRAIP